MTDSPSIPPDRPSGRIRLLDDAVINKIAAGEVVERPAAVVKELVENALDAGTDTVEVEVVGGGRTSIVVADRGCGMTRDDALLSIERHATSKIRDVGDIERIATLGFRGEALAAIAAVSRFTLQTCVPGATAGTEVEIAGGKLMDVRDAGVPPGTRIAVRNLFFNVPARRKFLRTDATETAHIRQMVLLYALAYPAVAFRLQVDGRDAYRFPAHPSLEDRLAAIFPETTRQALRPVSGTGSGVRIGGRAGLPATGRPDRSEQYLFVNRRPAAAALLQYAVAEAYRTVMPRERHPSVVLFVDVAPEDVDVNVHPTKREVRFRRPGAVRDTVIAALRQALELPVAPVSSPETAGLGGHPEIQAPVPPVHTPWLPTRPSPPSAGTAPLGPLPAGVSRETFPPGADREAVPDGGPSAAWSPLSGGLWTRARVLGQAGGRFVVLDTPEGLVLLEPRAAHERVLYERYLDESQGGPVRSQGLLIPETIRLAPRLSAALAAQLDILPPLGFGVEEFGTDTFLVEAVPSILGAVPAAGLIEDLARWLDDAGPRGVETRLREETVARLIAQHAVRGAPILSGEEIARLLEDLAQTRMPYAAPDGRPTMLQWGYGELSRKFGRG